MDLQRIKLYRETILLYHYAYCISSNKHPCSNKCPLPDKQQPQDQNIKQAPLLNKQPFPFPILITNRRKT